MGVFSEKTNPRLTRIGALQWLERRSNFEQRPANQDHKQLLRSPACELY